MLNRYFHGTAAYVPYFFELVDETDFFEGDSREGLAAMITYRVSPEHRVLFPDLKRRRVIHIVDIYHGLAHEARRVRNR